MRKKAKNISRKEFIRSSSYGVIGTGLMANPPLNLFFPAESLKKISLGNTGIRLTKLGFGASRTQQASLLKYALDQGVTFIDTGRSYASGKNEEMVGSVIKGIRSDLTIQSKVRIRITNSSEESDSGSIHQRISDTFFKSLRESLQALQTDYIDIFLLHGASGEEEIYNEALLNAFNRAKEQGKIRAAGFSTHSNQAELVKSVNQKSSYNVIMVAFNPSGGYVHSVSARQDSWNQEELIRELKTATEKV